MAMTKINKDQQISIADMVMLAKAKRIKQWPVKSNRASQLGHSCLRYLVYERTRWEEKTLHNATLQSIFDLGKWFEKIVFEELEEAGLDLVEQQRPFFWKKYEIGGMIDAKLLIADTAIPLEIKSMSPYVWQSINSVDDIRYHNSNNVRAYLGQIMIYELMDGKDIGVFILKNKVTGQIKDIWIPLDYDLGESLLQKAEAINAHMANDTVPEPMDYDSKTCDECGYVHICMPDVIGKEVEISDDPEFEEALVRWWDLKPIVAQYEELEKIIKTRVEGKEKLVAGAFYIDGKWIESTKYNIPKEIKQQYAEKYHYWKKKIIKV